MKSVHQCAFSLGKERIGRGQRCRRQQREETAAEFDAGAAHSVENILVQCSWPKSSSPAKHILQHVRNKHIAFRNPEDFQLQNPGTAKPKAFATAHASNSKTENTFYHVAKIKGNLYQCSPLKHSVNHVHAKAMSLWHIYICIS